MVAREVNTRQGDLDLVVDPTRTNAKRIVKALTVFFGGVAPRYASEDAFMDQSTIVQLGVAPIRVDIISAFGTLTFAQAWKRMWPSPRIGAALKRNACSSTRPQANSKCGLARPNRSGFGPAPRGVRSLPIRLPGARANAPPERL